ncbi:MAG TPA: TetR/AcrR family transcriptional regulator [Solirubrobacteraceae bacterium]|nr:TetR/AcrR family transcriptional regulator [Solirubrobacteraceae bacterium]
MAATDQPRRRGRPPSGGREAILGATLALLREEGVAKLTSREVAARAGVSDASVYYHFGDREGLLRAAFAHGMKPLEFVTQPPAAMQRPAVLAAALASLEQFFDDVLPVLHAAQADAELGASLARYVAENDLGPHKGVTALGAYLRAEQAAGRADPAVDPEVVALMLIDAAFGRASRRLMLSPPDTADQNDRLPSAEQTLTLINSLLDVADA